MKVNNLKDSEEYANRIKKFDEYYGYLAWSLIYLYSKKGKERLGESVLTELTTL
jgi:hypothetical protein